MDNKTTIIIAAIVVAGVAVLGAAVFLHGYSHEVRYNYDATIADSYMSSSGYTIKADPGKEFVIIHYTIANDKGSEFAVSGLNVDWSLKVNGVTYDPSIGDTVYHKDYSSVKISAGAKASSVSVFEVPSTLKLSDMTIEFEMVYMSGSLHLVRDVTL